VTSRWLVEAATARDLTIGWRPYSLKVKHGDDRAEKHSKRDVASHRALRVIVALDEALGNDAVAAFYTERGYRAFGGEGADDLAGILVAAGLDPAHAEAADDTAHDPSIDASMDEAHRLAGDSSGSPIISIQGTGRGYFGPVLTAVPADAGALWDLVAGLTAIPELHEIKRDRQTGPSFPPRP